jgi:hypothetical protein
MEKDDHSRFIPKGMTRDCTDPWVYVEFRVDGGVSLCCVREPIGNIVQKDLAHILRSEHARSLRASLLSGKPDSICCGCGLRGVTSPADLQRKVRDLLALVAVPSGFDTVAYLAANPDVEASGLDPTQHFMDWGRLEGRALRVPGDAGSGPTFVAPGAK